MSLLFCSVVPGPFEVPEQGGALLVHVGGYGAATARDPVGQLPSFLYTQVRTTVQVCPRHQQRVVL